MRKTAEHVCWDDRHEKQPLTMRKNIISDLTISYNRARQGRLPKKLQKLLLQCRLH